MQSRLTGFGYKAPSFKELFPEASEKNERNILRTEINELIPMVQLLFSRAGISTTLAYTSKEHQGFNDSFVPQYNEKETTIDVLSNYFNVSSRSEFEYREPLIDAIDRGIGYFGELKKIELKSMFQSA